MQIQGTLLEGLSGKEFLNCIFYFFGDRINNQISKNQFYYFVDCFFRSVSKSFVCSKLYSQSDSLSESNFDQTFTDNLGSNVSDSITQEESKIHSKGNFYRLIPNGKIYKFLLKIVVWEVKPFLTS
jgi:hypothetical protein